jgi:hypothetical protein
MPESWLAVLGMPVIPDFVRMTEAGTFGLSAGGGIEPCGPESPGELLSLFKVFERASARSANRESDLPFRIVDLSLLDD